MKIFISVLAVFIISSGFASSLATAGAATDSLSTCLADNTTGKDRKDLARWVYVGMSSHPEIRELSNVTDRNRDDLNKMMAAMLTKLMTENCLTQTKLAIEKDGNEAIKTAFGYMGQLAMQELMANPEVVSSFSKFGEYIDKNKFKSAFTSVRLRIE